jgi:hypothetical protein
VKFYLCTSSTGRYQSHVSVGPDPLGHYWPVCCVERPLDVVLGEGAFAELRVDAECNQCRSVMREYGNWRWRWESNMRKWGQTWQARR